MTSTLLTASPTARQWLDHAIAHWKGLGIFGDVVPAVTTDRERRKAARKSAAIHT